MEIQLGEKLKQAVTCLNELDNNFLKSLKKKDLLSDELKDSIFLQVALKKIPQQKMVQMKKIHLPHSLLKENSEVCLITGDLDKKDTKAGIEPTVLYYKDLLQKHGINGITEVIPLRQLRTEYKSFETRRALLGAFDVFLADSKIAGVLPKVLGKFFFKKRKHPIQISMKTKNLKDQVENALSSTVLNVTGQGSSCVVQVGHHGLEIEQTMENVVAVVKSLTEALPGSSENILALHLKSTKSSAIPIYLSFDNSSAVEFNVAEKGRRSVVGELSTLPSKKVKIHPNLAIQVLDVAGAESDSESDSETKKQLTGKKRFEGNKVVKAKNKSQSAKQKKNLKNLTKEDKTLNDSANRTDSAKTIIPKKMNGYDSSEFKALTPTKQETKTSPKNLRSGRKFQKTAAGVNKISKQNKGARKPVVRRNLRK